MEGYKTEQFVEKLDENFLCPICRDVLRDPIMSCNNGHSFCRYCIKQWMRSVNRCPLDDSLIENKYSSSRNLALKGIIENLKVYCHPQGEDKNQETASVDVGLQHGAQMCKWIGKLQSLPTHQQTCPFQLVLCPHEHCIVKLQRRQIKEHEAKCKYKKVTCDSECGLILIRHELEKHKAHDCPETLVPCPNQCTTAQGLIQNMKRMNLDVHLKTVCGKTLVDCPFKDQGCSTQVERQSVDEHLQGNMAAHMKLMKNQNILLQEQLQELKTKNRNVSFGSYMWKIYDYHSLAKTKTKGTSLSSPMFIQCGHRWMLEVFPNGSSISSFGMMALRLYWVGDEEGKQYENCKVSAVVRLVVVGVKQGGKDHHSTKNVAFTKTNDYWEWDRFMRSNMALSQTFCDSSTGILQIHCQIQIKDQEEICQ